MNRPFIASLDLLALHANGARTPVTFRIGPPEQVPGGGWQCPVRLDGLHDGLIAMHGEDSMQALCLSLGLAAALLRNFVARGGRLLDVGESDDREDEVDWPLEAYFGWLGDPRAPAA